MPAKEEMTIVVSAEVAEIIHEAVSPGRHASESDFLEERIPGRGESVEKSIS